LQTFGEITLKSLRTIAQPLAKQLTDHLAAPVFAQRPTARISFIGASLYSYQWLNSRDVTWITHRQGIQSRGAAIRPPFDVFGKVQEAIWM
jgi:D-hexose-6-phosphate mutarotase